MTGLLSSSGKALAGLLAVAAVALLPLEAGAAGITFRNDLKTPVYVQGASIVRGMVIRGLPVLVLPGRMALDPQLPPGRRQITIYDANQRNRILHREVVPFNGQNVRYRIQLGTTGAIQLTLDDDSP